VPVVLIVLFWMVHILPEKIAHKRHHPQFEAIRTLCLLSLVFGGLLWPLAWLWAYSKPVMYKMAYGTDKDPEAETEHAHALPEPAAAEISLRERIARLEGRGIPETELKALHADLDAIEAKFAAQEVVR
jgi:CBS domain containing-hemolysin-like protein